MVKELLFLLRIGHRSFHTAQGMVNMLPQNHLLIILMNPNNQIILTGLQTIINSTLMRSLTPIILELSRNSLSYCAGVAFPKNSSTAAP